METNTEIVFSWCSIFYVYIVFAYTVKQLWAILMPAAFEVEGNK